ncbi:MAG TPA: hypothetical protein DCM14_04155 [Clostridiales bacterium UBA8153]|nr:hypothetical protein [Clostridiales bacterium UBA8153]
MWKDVPTPWRACFEEAWLAYCNGSTPVGAVVVSSTAEIVTRGRNRVYEAAAPPGQVAGTGLAHAELNALLQVGTGDDRLSSYTLYTTMEPCPLCFGAFCLSGLRSLRYAARDGLAGSVNPASMPGYFSSRPFDVAGPFPDLEAVQMAMYTAHIMERCPPDRHAELLALREGYCRSGVRAGLKLHHSRCLLQARQQEWTAGRVFDEVTRLLGVTAATVASQ